MAKTGFTFDTTKKPGIDLSQISQMKGKIVKVGFLNSKVEFYPDGSNTVQVALKNEYGGVFPTDGWKINATAAGRKKALIDQIPSQWNTTPRPFFRTAWDKNKEKYAKSIESFLNKSAKDAKTFNQDAVDTFLFKLGDTAKQDVRKSILNGDWEKNAPLVVALKGSDKPLVDTGRLVGAVDFSVMDINKKGSNGA